LDKVKEKQPGADKLTFRKNRINTDSYDQAITPKVSDSLQRDWKNFIALSFLFSFGFCVYAGVFQNYLLDVIHTNALGVGRLESIREIPGLLAALIAGTLASLAESKIAAVGLAVAAIGIGLSGMMPSYGSLIAITVFWSVGFHLYQSVASALTMALAKGKDAGHHLSRLRKVAAIGTIVALAVSYAASLLLPHDDYQPYFITSGIAIFMAAIICSTLSAHADGGKRKNIVFKRKYSLYYILTFLDGCRRQIFSIFASFALIFVFHQSLIAMLALQLINAIIITIAAPPIGRLIDRLGEKRPLTWYAVGLIVVFLGYALVGSVQAMYLLFIIDNFLFSLNVGFTTYLHRTSETQDFTPSLAMGTTMNHVAAVTVPYFGALLWIRTGNYQAPFWVGVGIAAVSLFATQALPNHPKNTAIQEPEILQA